MEPPKKRKFLALDGGKGALAGHPGLAVKPCTMMDTYIKLEKELAEQQNVVSNSGKSGEEGEGGGNTAARRNRRKYSVDFKVRFVGASTFSVCTYIIQRINLTCNIYL